jgi:hypothetical protein
MSIACWIEANMHPSVKRTNPPLPAGQRLDPTQAGRGLPIQQRILFATSNINCTILHINVNEC